MNIAEKILRLKQDFDDVYNANQGSSTDEWFDQYQTNCEARAYTYAFAYACWDDSIYFPIREIDFDKGLKYTTSIGAFRQTNISDTKVPIKCTTSGQGYIFQGAKLVTINKVVVSEATTFDNWFNNAVNLQNIEFEGSIGNSISFPHSPLSTASIVNIFEHLSSTKSATLTLKTSTKEAMVFPYISLETGMKYESWDDVYNIRGKWEISLA